MTTQISTKLAALAVALMINSTMIGGIAYLFDGNLPKSATISSLAHAPATMSPQTSA